MGLSRGASIPILTTSPSILVTLMRMLSPITIPSCALLDRISITNPVNLDYFNRLHVYFFGRVTIAVAYGKSCEGQTTKPSIGASHLTRRIFRETAEDLIPRSRPSDLE